jgi:hypothetical protein
MSERDVFSRGHKSSVDAASMSVCSETHVSAQSRCVGREEVEKSMLDMSPVVRSRVVGSIEVRQSYPPAPLHLSKCYAKTFLVVSTSGIFVTLCPT